MDIRAIVKAKSRLRVAANALKNLREVPIGDYNLFCDSWYIFLVAAKNIYTVIEQGCKNDPQAMQWFGAKKAERRVDSLIRYMYEARNDDEHGLEPGTEPVAESIALAPPKEGQSNSIRVRVTDGEIIIEGLDGMPPPDITHTPPTVKLIPVHDRERKPHNPPTEHLQVTLTDTSPLNVAILFLAYLEKLVSEAEGKCRT